MLGVNEEEGGKRPLGVGEGRLLVGFSFGLTSKPSQTIHRAGNLCL